ncbi:MAG: phosphatidate cytidylyltransferase [Betaproteobacteria bacterium]|nr:phosphatidate cytidylyltransferase [Betaproteobacteria bacterium]
MLRARILTAAALLALLGVLLFKASPAVWQGAILVAVLGASWEWAGLARFPDVSRGVYVLATAGLAGLLSWAAVPDSTAMLKALYAVSMLFWVAGVPFWLIRQWRVESPAMLALTGWVVILPAGFALISLRMAGPWVLLMFMMVVWLSDTAAYLVGRVVGQHKLAPVISPGKTWEGVAGAFAVVLIYAVTLWQWDAQGKDAIGQVIHATGSGWIPLLLAMTVLGIEGDLFESWIKRCAGVKDSGTALPGHGGILDRIDALTATLPLVALMLLEQG